MRIFFLLFNLFFVLQASVVRAGSPDAADSLNHFQNLIAGSKLQSERLQAAERCAAFLRRELENDAFYTLDFSAVKGMGVPESPDKAFRLFNWNVPLDDGTHRYYCFVHFNPELDFGTGWVEFQQTEREPDKLESRQFDIDEWLGCLYYEIIPVVQKRKNTYYILLGWDGHNRMSTRKFIEVLAYQGKRLRFGSAVFKSEKGVKKRVVFEYNPEVQMSLRYQEKQKRIVFDHLAPRAAGLEGNYSFYGPDLTFDAYHLEKGMWIYQEDVDVRQDKDNKPYYNPRPE